MYDLALEIACSPKHTMDSVSISEAYESEIADEFSFWLIHNLEIIYDFHM